MKTSYHWLQQYLDLSDVTPQQLADVMTNGGLEVEAVTPQAAGTKLVIGLVEQCVPHPDSDHLHVCQVYDGTGRRQIVCGAPNVAAGQKVIVALPGCQLPGGEITASTIRGQASDGMICALFELGVDRHQLTEQQLNGIEVLPDDAPVGETKVLEYLHLDDTLYDVDLTPNRADCLASWALAKEVGALLDKPVRLPQIHVDAPEKPADLVVRSETPKCSYYAGKVIGHVTIKPSPRWLQEALHSVGVKAINNVVDISNFVMLETGQPLHFYDLAKIPGREITVKTGLEETYTALDGTDYAIRPQDIMITTQGRAIGIAGIMGGEDSKIDESTSGIIIEAAAFDPVSIRNTARRLGMDTDASVRFQKGIDPLGPQKAVKRSVQLLCQLADADGLEATVTAGRIDYQPVQVPCSVRKINALLGTGFTTQQMLGVFRRLDFAPVLNGDDEIVTTIPSYRRDVENWQDLSEEVIRLMGYDHIVSTLPLMPTVQGGLSADQKKRRMIAAVLNGAGLSEIITYSLVSKALNDEGILPCGQAVEIANPISEERRYYRTSLLPSMLAAVSYNVARNCTAYGLFETADVYSDDQGRRQRLSIALSAQHAQSLWDRGRRPNDFYTMKGLVESVLAKLGYESRRLSYRPLPQEQAMLHPGRSAEIRLDRQVIGVLGEVHPECDRRHGLGSCVLAELDLTAIYAEKPAKVHFAPIPKYPAVSYDLAMIVDQDVTAAQITEVIRKAGGSLLKQVTVFDVYQGLGIPAGKKSVAVTLSWQSQEKTLAEGDIAPLQQAVIDQLGSKLGAVLRAS
jgi:phenylalanyl-tRNA synthetase beta chain